MNMYENLELILKRAILIDENSDDQAVADVASDLGLVYTVLTDQIIGMVADEHTEGLVSDLRRAHYWACKHQYSVRNLGPEYPAFAESLRDFREEIDYVRESLAGAREHESE